MDTGAMKKILLEEMQEYTGKGLNDYAYLTSNETNQIYTVVDIATIRDKRIVSTVLVARIVGQQIVIEIDHHDKQLVDALLARDVPEEQIILAYRGDAVPV
ncbi:MAG: element excision factor XisI family protein [Phototrophicaceae bacterium]